VRMLLIHGARSALNAARRRAQADKPLTHLQTWALKRADTAHSNKAAVALANKLVRISWAVWYHERDFNSNYAVRAAA
jgi:transposase